MEGLGHCVGWGCCLANRPGPTEMHLRLKNTWLWFTCTQALSPEKSTVQLQGVWSAGGLQPWAPSGYTSLQRSIAQGHALPKAARTWRLNKMEVEGADDPSWTQDDSLLDCIAIQHQPPFIQSNFLSLLSLVQILNEHLEPHFLSESASKEPNP